jgi:long-chain acyl-CoA synthetase
MTLTPLQYFLKWESETPKKEFLRQPKNDQWHVYTFQQAGDEIARIASAIRKLDLPPKSNIGILSKNCAHWIMADLATMLSGHISVPIYPTLSGSGINQILTHSETKVLFVGKLDDYENQKSDIPEQVKKISIDFYGISEGLLWDDLIKENPPLNAQLPKENELATIMYSSGTTGTPKGVMLTHGIFGYVGKQVMINLGMTKRERFFSYLPLSHIAERGLMEMSALACGGSISFVESLDKFSENLQHEMPTIFGGVPRIYLKFQEGVLKKLPQQKLTKLLSIPLVGSIIKKSIQKKLGLAKARIVVSGAAPTPGTLIAWFQTIGITVRETYGMTENTAFSHSNYKKIKIGTVGQPWPGVETKLSNEGEILIKSEALMQGYFKDPETTAQVFTNEGFLRTGDEGSIDEEGFLTITGRIKDQFKTDKAKFVAPAPIELKILANRDIEQVCVVGINLPQPIALVTLTATARAKATEKVEQELRETIQKVNETLESYEHLKTAIILKQDWSIENGLLTPSMKVKRNEIEKIYHPKYSSWYDQRKEVIWEK